MSYVIIVEGIADAAFVYNCIKYINQTKQKLNLKSKPKFKKGDPTAIDKENKLKIFVAGGCTSLNTYKSMLIQYYESNYKIVLIFDTDDKSKSFGGYDARRDYLEEQKVNIGIDFEYFLMPNNQDDGDLESILINIVNEERYTEFIRCYEGYINCISHVNNAYTSELKEDKLRVFNYLQVNTGMDDAKEHKRNYLDEKLWNLTNPFLVPMISFIEGEFF